MRCTFDGYCDRQNMANSKECLAKPDSCSFQSFADKPMEEKKQ